jgi:hypothetical protein
MVFKINPSALKPGDMWCRGKDDNLILIASKSHEDEEMKSLTLWELTWFGEKQGRQEVFSSCWTSDSKFHIVSRAQGN